MPNTKFKLSSATIAVLLFVLCNNANAGSMTDIGRVGSNFMSPSEISNDGKIVGTYVTLSGLLYTYHAYKYENGTYSNLGTGSSAYAITSDGSTIVGSNNGSAARFNADGTITDLGVLSGGSVAGATAISDDGSVIVGYSSTSFLGPIHAFKYQGGVMTDLGTLGGPSSSAEDVSANGLVIVGSSMFDGTGKYHAFKYENSVMSNLGTLGGAQSFAYATSDDGSVIIGDSEFDGTTNTHAFKYQNGVMADIGTLGGTNSNGYSVSGNGQVIVGTSQLAGDAVHHAFKYVNGTMTDLGTLGGSNSNAYAISQDGRIIVGTSDITGNTDSHNFILLNSDGISGMVDVNNTYSVLSKNAAQLNSVLNLNSALLAGTLEQDAKIFGKHGISVSVGGSYFGVKSDTNKNNASQFGGTLKVAYQFNKNFHAGIFFDQSVSTSLPNNFKSQNQLPFIGIFATLKENLDGSGAQLRLAGAYNSSDLNISRDVLSNTEAGMGKASLISKAALAELAYGLKLSTKFILQPYAGIRVSEITRSSYSETSGADFPIAFKAASKKSTTAIFGARLNMNFTDALQARIGGGLEHDLSNSIDGYAGSIYALGNFNLTPSKIQKNRGFANVGIGYNLTKLQNIGIDIYYSKQQLNSANTIGAYVQYSIGF